MTAAQTCGEKADILDYIRTRKYSTMLRKVINLLTVKKLF